MINSRTFLKIPLNFTREILIYPPSVKEVLGNLDYGSYQRIFTISQEDLDEEIYKGENKNHTTPLEFLLINCYNSPEFLEMTKKAFWFFTRQEITILYEQKKILLGDLRAFIGEAEDLESLKNIPAITEDNFFEFQNSIRIACGGTAIKPPEPIDPDEDPRIAKIKAKARARDRIKAKKGTVGGISFDTCLVAICCMGIGLTPLNIGEMSYAAVEPIMKTCQSKEKYEIDIRSLQAGADSKKIKPKYWIEQN